MSTKTSPPDTTPQRQRVGRTVRRVAVGALSLFVLLGATSFLGVRTSTASGGTSSDYFLTVDYGSISRAGLNTPLRIHVRKAQGFSGPITIGITQSYMSLFDLNGLYPNPSAMTVRDRTLLMEFDPPPSGDQFNFTLDARLGPSVQRGKTAHVSVLEDDVEVASVDITTWVIP